MFFSMQGFAEEGDRRYAAIEDVLIDVATLNQQISENKDETKLTRLIKNKDDLFDRLMMVIRGSALDYDIESINKSELQLLNSKIRINRARGNKAAVQRDQFSIDYYLAKRDIGSLVSKYTV
jgi:MscS family membrane protein